MPFEYTRELLSTGLTYAAYRKGIDDLLDTPAPDEHAEKIRHYIRKNVLLMTEYDETYTVADTLNVALATAPHVTWLVITESWCGDAAFNVPMLAAIEKALPEKVTLKFFLRDSNLHLIDANLTDGGRSIPKMVVLNDALEPLGHWGPRPAKLQGLMKAWKNEGLELKYILGKVKDWYNTDATQTLQNELISLVKSYSTK